MGSAWGSRVPCGERASSFLEQARTQRVPAWTVLTTPCLPRPRCQGLDHKTLVSVQLHPRTPAPCPNLKLQHKPPSPQLGLSGWSVGRGWQFPAMSLSPAALLPRKPHPSRGLYAILLCGQHEHITPISRFTLAPKNHSQRPTL